MPLLSLHSRVSLGAVGNALIEAAFLRLAPGVPLFTVDSVHWTAPGNHPRRCGPVIGGKELEGMLRMLLDPTEAGGGGARAMMTGYLRTAEQVEAVVRVLDDAPPLDFLLVDPVLGDNGRLYVAEETAAAVRDLLVPRADYLLPNVTEAAWLVGGMDIREFSMDELLLRCQNSLARRDDGRPRTVVVKSIPAGEAIGVHVLGEESVTDLGPRVPGAHSGTGDLFAGCFAARLLTHPGRHASDAARSARQDVTNALRRYSHGGYATLRQAFLDS